MKPPSTNLTIIIVAAIICLTCYLVCNKGKNIIYNEKDGLRVMSAPDSASLSQNKMQLDTTLRNIEKSMSHYDTLIEIEPDEAKKAKLRDDRKASENLYGNCNSMIAEYNEISVMPNSDLKNERFKNWIDKSKSLFGKYSNQSASTIDVFFDLVGHTRKIADNLKFQVEKLQKDTARLNKNNDNLVQQLTAQKKEVEDAKAEKEEEKRARVKAIEEIGKVKADSLRMATDLKVKEEIILENAVMIKNLRPNPQGKRQRFKNNILYVNNNNSEFKLEILFQVKFLPGVSSDTIYAEIDKTMKLTDANVPKTICDKTFNYQNHISLSKTDEGRDLNIGFIYDRGFEFGVYTITLHSTNCKTKMPEPFKIEIQKGGGGIFPNLK